MKNWLLAALLFIANSVLAESGNDKKSPLKNVDLLCGPVNGVFIMLSSKEKKAWYTFRNKANYDSLKLTKFSEQIDGVAAPTYIVEKNRSQFPTKKNPQGSVVVRYQSNYDSRSYMAHLLNFKVSSSGILRVYIADTSYHGVCKFLE